MQLLSDPLKRTMLVERYQFESSVNEFDYKCEVYVHIILESSLKNEMWNNPILELVDDLEVCVCVRKSLC